MPAFSAVVTGEAWHADVRAWLADVVAGRGHEVTSVAQPRVRPWSTQLVVETTGGRLWFKAGCARTAFEPGLQSALARLVPHAVDAPVAGVPDRSPSTVPDRFTTVLDRLATLPPGHPARLADDVAARQPGASCCVRRR